MVFFTCGELVLVIWRLSYVKEYLWNLGTKLCSITPGKYNDGKVAFKEFNVKHRILYHNHEGRDRFSVVQGVY